MFSARKVVPWFWLSLLLACGGSSGGAGCGTVAGTEPLPPTIENPVSVRLTRPGLDFLGQNLGGIAGTVMGESGGIFSTDIPRSSQSSPVDLGFLGTGSLDVTVCPNGADAATGRCRVDVDLKGAALRVDALAPNAVRIAGSIPVRAKYIEIGAALSGVLSANFGNFGVGFGAGSCVNGAPSFDFKSVPVDIELPLVKETVGPRAGFTRVDGSKAKVHITLDSSDLAVCRPCNILQSVCDAVFSAVKDIAFARLAGTVEEQLKSFASEGICQSVSPESNPVCPIGSHAKEDKCMLDAEPERCLSQLLGTRSLLSLASLPGAGGEGLDMLFAVAGDANTAPSAPPDSEGHSSNGLTLSLRGALSPKVPSDCIKRVDNPLPENIPIPDELLSDAPFAPGAPKHHLAAALSGRFLTYALRALYNSGVFCLGLSTEDSQALNSGTLSLLAGSTKRLTLEQKPAAAAISVRPEAPPSLRLGTGKDVTQDPLLFLKLDKVHIDFFVQSYDRFVRVFTMTTDLSIPLNLETTKDPVKNPEGGLLPVLGSIKLENTSVANANLLTEDPTTLAKGLEELVSAMIGDMIGGAIPPVDLSFASAGLSLAIPEGGIRKVEKGTDAFLGVFAALASAPLPQGQFRAGGTVREQVVFRDAMTLASFRDDKRTRVRVAFSDEGGEGVEHAYRLDRGTRSAWTREAEINIQHPMLFLQGKHVLTISGRKLVDGAYVAGAETQIPIVVDVTGPELTLKLGANGDLSATAWDYVSDVVGLRARFLTGEMETEWMPIAQGDVVVPNGAHAVEVRASDESGNVTERRLDLIRGRRDGSLGAGGSGCSCDTVSGRTRGPVGLSLALLGAILLIRRRAKVGWLVPLAFGMVQGCACDDATEDTPQGTQCGVDCNQECGPPNEVGIVGAYTSLAVAKDGTIWVSGYNDFDPKSGSAWGDLVAGRYDATKGRVDWQTVDGVPKRTDKSCPTNDRKSWRGGETDPGENVGLWTSIAVGDSGIPMVAYFDLTRKALKFASLVDGTWEAHTIKGGAPGLDAGRYAKVLLEAGKPVVGYLVMEKGRGGFVRSKIELARAKTERPAGPDDWTLESTVADEEGPCRVGFCSEGEVCVLETGRCQARVPGCTPQDCKGGSSERACVLLDAGPACQSIADDKTLFVYPNAFGAYVSMALGPEGLGIAMYDRIRGNLMALRKRGGAWEATLLDGETGTRIGQNPTAVDTGDVGVGTSLAIGSDGTWHVSYVNGLAEALMYIRVRGGIPDKPEVVDRGVGLGDTVFDDGKHVVGDDSFVEVGADARIFYQDATAGTLRVAERSGATWKLRVLAQEGRFAGFFPVRVPNQNLVANFWRRTDRATKTFTGDVSFVSF